MEVRCKKALFFLATTETKHMRWRMPPLRTEVHIKVIYDESYDRRKDDKDLLWRSGSSET